MELLPANASAASSGRLAFASMFYRPAATLACLGERPHWLCPLLLTAVYSVAVNLYLVNRMGLERLIKATLKSGAAFDADSVMQSALAHKSQILSFQGGIILVSTFVTAFIVAKVLWLIVELTGEHVAFRKILAIVAHATMLTVVARQSMLALTATIMRDMNKFDLINPLATNPAFFMQPASPVWFRLLAALDVIRLANVFLLAFGLSRVCRGLSLSKACAVVAVPWGVYTAASLFR